MCLGEEADASRAFEMFGGDDVATPKWAAGTHPEVGKLAANVKQTGEEEQRGVAKPIG
jgi:hypothetical protein